jgi:phosphoserine phosphatase
LEEKKVNEICHNLPIMPGAEEIIKALKKENVKVLVFSGGFRNATSYYKDILGYDADFSNFLHSKNGILTGLVGGEMMHSNAKGDMLRRIQNVLGVSKDETMVVGDGANDLSMFKYAGVRVAFCAKDVLKKEANIIIEEKDLSKILEFI